MDQLTILSKTIADHARKLAYEEWQNEHQSFWQQILSNAGLGTAGATLEVDGRTIPIESISKALREEFLKTRVAQLVPKVTQSVIETAFKKVIDEEEKS
jgi:histone H3/H4